MRIVKFVAVILLLPTVTLTGCSQPGPDAAIESFLEALVSKDNDKLFAAVCSEWEAQAALEFDAFMAVTGALEGVECKQTGTESDYTLVSCQGKIALNYDGERRDMPLENYTYLAKQDGGEWKMCGYR